LVDIRRKGKIPVRPGEPPKDAEFIEVRRSDEKWNEYELDDGTYLRLKLTAIEIWRVENEYDGEGNPVYVIKSHNLMSVRVPENLKQKRK
jgi:hypothetical protein